MKEHLKEFLSEWLAWANADAPDHPVFAPTLRLCFTFGRWLEHEGHLEDMGEIPYHILGPMFEADGLDHDYPFDDLNYYRSQHRCPERLEWVKAQLRA